MPTALLYDPYIDTLGGGERYVLTVAQTLLDHGWKVTLAWTNTDIIKAAHQRFGLSLVGLKIDPELNSLFTSKHDFYSRWQKLHNFDLVFFVSDGSVPVLFGKKILVHFQVPFTSTNRWPILNMLKLNTISTLVINSEFTKEVINRTLHTTRSVVLYPPVDTKIFNPHITKENIILNVGRFASPSHAKRQDVLIQAFRQLSSTPDIDGWKLILAGGVFDQDKLDEMKKSAQGLNIEFVENPTYPELIKLYERSKIYWHAAGYEVDELLNPESVEHFGITTVEAMAAGCVPVVIGKGGQKEIVDIDSGYLCQNSEDIIKHTLDLIKYPDVLSSNSKQAVLRAKQFDQSEFSRRFLDLVK